MYWDALQSAWGDWVLEYDFTHQIQLARAVQDHTRGAALILIGGLGEGFWTARRFWETLPVPVGDGASTPFIVLLWVAMAAALAAATVVAVRKLLPLCGQAYHARRLVSGRGVPADSTYFYLRALRVLERRGLPRRIWQTPEEFLRAAETGECRGLMGQITTAYGAARFGRDRDAERRLPALVQALERARF
jgi:hypothetical protein